MFAPKQAPLTPVGIRRMTPAFIWQLIYLTHLLLSAIEEEKNLWQFWFVYLIPFYHMRYKH